MFEIDDDVPAPVLYRDAKGGTSKYPFAAMAVGESFTVPADAPIHLVRTAAAVYARKNGCKFSTRRTADGYRVWRVA